GTRALGLSEAASLGMEGVDPRREALPLLESASCLVPSRLAPVPSGWEGGIAVSGGAGAENNPLVWARSSCLLLPLCAESVPSASATAMLPPTTPSPPHL
ncbi:hypothetical protein Vafri_3857, partial [Volvox africanus]